MNEWWIIIFTTIIWFVGIRWIIHLFGWSYKNNLYWFTFLCTTFMRDVCLFVCSVRVAVWCIESVLIRLSVFLYVFNFLVLLPVWSKTWIWLSSYYIFVFVRPSICPPSCSLHHRSFIHFCFFSRLPTA